MTNPAPPDSTAAACRYLLVALLQRLETSQPGLLADLRAGVEGDQRAITPAQASPEVTATFAEALRMLLLAQSA